MIWDCPKLSLVPSPFRIVYKAGGVCGVGRQGEEGGGLQALHHLNELRICRCPMLLSAYKDSISSSCCPFPSSLQTLQLDRVEGIVSLEPLSNLTSLTELIMKDCGDYLRSNGLWALVTQGQLSDLTVSGSPKFFVGSDPARELKDEYQELQHLRSSFKLRVLRTDDIAVLAAPICSILSSSLIMLLIYGNKEVERFTKQQEGALQPLTSLKNLHFVDCYKLQCLPAGLRRLPNLKTMVIDDCPAISSLPEDGLPSSLEHLSVFYCGNEELYQQCRNVMGYP